MPAKSRDADENFLGGWLNNFFQYSYTDYTPKALANIPQPYVEYLIYCTFKSAELAAFLGGIIARPIYASYLWKKVAPDKITPNTPKIIAATCRKLSGRLLLGSFAAAPLFMAASIHLNGYTRKTLTARCYEIRCDKRVLVQDRAAFLLGFVGWYWKRFQGAVDGINIALFYSVLYVKVFSKYTHPFMFITEGLEPRLMEGQGKYPGMEDFLFDSSALLRFAKKKIEELSAGKVKDVS